MRTILFAAALMLGSAALAQQTPYGTSDMQGQTAVPLATTSSTGAIAQPDNSNPEHDARGIAVISDPAMVPPGFNGTGGAVGGPLEPVGSEESYPNCSRTITDNCLQAYERGRGPE